MRCDPQPPRSPLAQYNLNQSKLLVHHPNQLSDTHSEQDTTHYNNTSTNLHPTHNNHNSSTTFCSTPYADSSLLLLLPTTAAIGVFISFLSFLPLSLLPLSFSFHLLLSSSYSLQYLRRPHPLRVVHRWFYMHSVGIVMLSLLHDECQY